MKNVLLIGFMLAGVLTGKLLAQSPETGNKEKMKPFAAWVGHWQGEGYVQMGPGEPQKSTIDERIESKLDGTVLLIEGVGKSMDAATQQEKIVHHALAVLSFDRTSDTYKFRSYLNDGRSTDAWLNILAENKYQWGFDTPQGKIRYNVIIDPLKNTWQETGEFSSDGTTWRKFMEMNLSRIN